MSQAPQRLANDNARYATALGHYRAQRLGECERSCREILARTPADVEALHLLGLACVQTARVAEAVGYFDEALAAGGPEARLSFNRGVALGALGRQAEAADAYRRAAELDPAFGEAFTNLGVVLRAQGRLEEAAQALNQAVEASPKAPEPLCSLGAVLADLKRYEAAVEASDAALRLRPAYAEAHNNRGAALRELGRTGEAEAAFRRAAQLKPDYLDPHNNLGNLYALAGRKEEALAAFRAAVALEPAHAEAHNNLAVCLREAERYEEALAECRRAIELKPDFAEAYSNLGSAFQGLRRREEAVEAFARAVSLKPDFAEGHGNLGQALGEVGRLDEALAECRRAIELKPDFIKAHVSLASILEERGRTAEAVGAVDRALAADPEFVGAWVMKAEQKTFAPDDPDIAAMESVLAHAHARGISAEDRRALGFALGKAWTDANEADRAFAHLEVANRSRRATFDYDVEADAAGLAAIAETFTPDLLARSGGAGDPSELPVFVFGMPRSGTTLVEQILASHSQVTGAGELGFVRELAERVRSRDGAPAPYPAFVPSLTAANLEALGGFYRQKAEPLANGRPRLVDKMPGNFRWAGLIRLVLPNARLIHCRRDPMDSCFSCYGKNFAGEQPFAYDLSELGRYWRAYDALMAHWRKVLPPARFIEVAYEEVVEDLERQARRLVGFLGLEWEEACLKFHETRRPVATASVNQVRRPLYSTSVGRWKPFERHLGPLIEALHASDASGRPLGAPPSRHALSSAASHLPHEGGGQAPSSSPFVGVEGDQGPIAWPLIAGTDHAKRGGGGEAQASRADLLAVANEALEADRLEEAERLLRDVLEIEPGAAEALHGLGVTALRAGRMAEAAGLLERTCAAAPELGDAHYNLGHASRGLSRNEAAAGAFGRAVELRPRFAVAHANLGAVLHDLGRAEEALAAHRRAAELDPAMALAHFNLGNELEALGRAEEAAAAYRRTVELEPRFAKAQVNLAIVLGELGLLDEASSALDRALAADPANAKALGVRSRSKIFTAGDPEISAMEALLAGTAGAIDLHDRLSLEFALGKAWMDAGDGVRAFAHLRVGNRLKREAYGYDVEADADAMAGIAGAFTPELMERLAGQGDPSERPVFVLGMPRSGSTLIEQILASHSKVTGAGELKEIRETIVEAERATGAPYPQLAASLTGQDLEALGRFYLSRTARLAGDAARLVDKLPGNFQAAGLIHLILPGARIIHSRREALDTCLSCYTKDFTDDQPFAYDLAELGRYWRAYDALMAHWRRVLPPGRFLELDYEALVDDLEGQARRLIAFLGLEWEDACLSFHETRRRVKTASASQVRQPLYKTSIARWKPFESQLMPLIEALRPSPPPQGGGGQALADLLAAAMAELASGRVGEAERALREILAREPAHAESLHQLGRIALRDGRHGEAAELIEKLLKVRPLFAEAHYNLGVALYDLGRLPQASEAFARAVDLDGTLIAARFNLGNALHDLGRDEEALAHHQRVVQLQPELAAAHFNLGNELKMLGRNEEAAAAFARAAELQPGLAEAHTNLGAALRELGRPAEAEAAYRRAAEANPKLAAAHNNLSVVLHELAREDEAAQAARRAIDLDAGYAEAWANLATALQALGGTTEALAATDRALAIDLGLAPAWKIRSELKTFVADDAEIAAMEALLDQARAHGSGEQANLEFALGKAWMDAGDGERAFAHLGQANRLKRATFDYDVEADAASLLAVAQTFTPALMARLAGAGEACEAPVFVIGMPRSGTTLVEQILASHPQVTGAGELKAMPDVLAAAAARGEIGDYPAMAAGLTAPMLARLGRAYLDEILPLAKARRRVVDKMTGNFRFAGLIHLMLPNARIIHCRRDPIDTCLSCYTKSFIGHVDFTYDLEELGRFYRAYETLMAHWRLTLPAERFLEVGYEALVDDLEGEARRLVDFLGLQWDKACLAFHETKRPVRTASANQVRQPIYRTSLARWKPYERHLGPLIEALGRRAALRGPGEDA